MLQRLFISYRRQSFASLPVHFLLCSGRRLRCSSPLCSPSLPYALKTPTQPTPPQQPCYCPPSTRNCSWGIPTLQSAVAVRDAVSARGWARHPWHKQQRRLGGVSLCFCHRQQQQQQQQQQRLLFRSLAFARFHDPHRRHFTQYCQLYGQPISTSCIWQ
jgi:hypothetical protein